MINIILKGFCQTLHDQKMTGLIEKIERKREKSLKVKFFHFLDQKCIGVLNLMKYFSDLEKDLPNEGLHSVANNFLNRIRIKYLLEKDCPKFTSENDRPVLFVGINHEAIVEPLIMAAILKRQDWRLVGFKALQVMGDHLAKFVIPVLMRRHAVDYKNNLEKSIQNLFNPVSRLYQAEKLTIKEIKKLNQDSITTASQSLVNGKAVVIFPGGAGKVNFGWKSGIGEIIKQIPPSCSEKITILPVYFTGISRINFFRNMCLSFIQEMPERMVKVALGKARTIRELMGEIGENNEPSQISILLQRILLKDFAFELNRS